MVPVCSAALSLVTCVKGATVFRAAATLTSGKHHAGDEASQGGCTANGGTLRSHFRLRSFSPLGVGPDRTQLTPWRAYLMPPVSYRPYRLGLFADRSGTSDFSPTHPRPGAP